MQAVARVYEVTGVVTIELLRTSNTPSAPVHSNGGGAADDFTFPVADLVGLPFTRAQKNPHGACLSWSEGRMDNTEFAAAVAATAREMSTKHSIGRGSVVGVLLRNVPEVITTLFATWSLGAAPDPDQPGAQRRRGALPGR